MDSSFRKRFYFRTGGDLEMEFFFFGVLSCVFSVGILVMGFS